MPNPNRRRRDPQNKNLHQNGQKTDPVVEPCRIADMLSANTTLLNAERRPAKPQISERKSVSQGSHEISQQTRWMLAVRDSRDRDAFVKLFDFFAPRLKGFIMRTGTSSHQAEEIVQDVMLTIWRKAAQFDPHRAQVSAWVYQIARNRQIDLARKENRPLPEELKEDPGQEQDASQILGVEQETAKLRLALKTLNPDQREIIEQAYLGELTHHEISAKTGIPLGTIKSRIRLGLARLRHELKDLTQ